MSRVHIVVVTEAHKVIIKSAWTNQEAAEQAAADIRLSFSGEPDGWRLDRMVHVLSMPVDAAGDDQP